MKSKDHKNAFPCLEDSSIDIGEEAVLYIVRVADMLARIGDLKVFRKTLTQAQFNILMILKRHGQDGMSQKEILANLVTTKGNVSIHIANLTRKSYIRRKTSKKDSRMNVITLTPKGKRILEQMEPVYMQLLKEFTADLPREQIEATTKLLNNLWEKCENALKDSDISREKNEDSASNA